MHYYTHEELDGATRASLNGFARSAKIHGRSKMKVNELRDALRKQLPPREGTSPGLFVELCAGTAALSLRLHKEQAKPPVSRMGSKTGYATAILHELGLYPGLKAERYLWCEPDDGCRLLLETYRDHDLATAAAEIIRGWKDEDPKSLWTRLRKEGPAVAPTPREAARWCYVADHSYRRGFPKSGFRDDLAAYQRGTRGKPRHAATRNAENIGSLPTIPGEITDEAVDPREAARWCVSEAWTNQNQRYMGPDRPSKCHPPGWVASITLDGLNGRVSTLPALPGEITDGAVEPPLLPPNTVVYIDPPYVNTTGYKHNLGRDRVVELALAWHAAGATVCISEQEAIPELVAAGWGSVDVTGKRQGQKRTFSKQNSEYLTVSPTPLEHEKVAPND